MPEGLGPRVAVETGFLILLAVGAAVADLEPLLIVLVMAIGWILVSLVELLASRSRQGLGVSGPLEARGAPGVATQLPAGPPIAEPAAYAVAYEPPAAAQYPPAPALEPPGPEEPLPEQPPPEAPAAEPQPHPSDYDFEFTKPGEPEDVSATGVLEPAAEHVEPEPPASSAAAEAGTTGFAAPQRQRVSHRLPPLQPRAKRSWFGRAARRQEKPKPEEEEANLNG